MPTPISYIVHRASEMCGLKEFYSDSMDGDDFRKVFLMAQDAIRTLNQQSDITFAYTIVNVQVTGTSLVFKPYTAEEQAIIDGGGTVDISNRVVSIRPVICPAVYINDTKLSMVEVIDLPKYRDKYTCAWNPDWDQDTIMFGSSVNGEVSVNVRKPITVPVLPNDNLEVPERFNDFIICTLAYNLACVLTIMESIPIIRANLATARRAITGNNTYHRPQYLNTDMGRFNT